MVTGSITNGWDAVAAFDVAQLNDVLFQQYLQQGPAAPAINIRCVLTDPTVDGFFTMLDLTLGPPQISFPSDLSAQQLDVTMLIVSGTVLTFSAAYLQIGPILNVTLPADSAITGTIPLSNLPGQDILGTVQLDLSNGTYQATMEGIAPGSAYSTAIGDALQSYFASNSTKYIIATIAQGTIPTELTPQNFELYLQAAPDGSGDGALLLLIQMTGTPGQVGALPIYPIPSGSGSISILSANAIMTYLFDALTSAMPGVPIGTFAYGDMWSVAAQSSELAKQVEDENGNTSDSDGDKEPVVLSLKGFGVGLDNGPLQFAWYTTTTTYFTLIDNVTYGPIDLAVNWSVVLTLSIDTGTGIVSFPSLGQPTVSWDASVGYAQEVGQLLQEALDGMFGGFALPPINTFAVSNLAFASANSFVPTSVSIPFDLWVPGVVSPGLQLSPPMTTLAATSGATQSWTVTSNGQPLDSDQIFWAKLSGPGTLSSQGVYTPPAGGQFPAVVIVNATDTQNTQVTGSAMLIVYQPQSAGAITIDPPAVTLTNQGQCTFTASTAVTVTMEPNFGVLSPGDTPNTFIYSAPSGISKARTVTITATSTDDSSLSATVTVTLLVQDTSMAITQPSSTDPLPPGQTYPLSVSADLVDNFTWAIYPPGLGTIAPVQGNPNQAVYTAPSSPPPQNTTVYACAHGTSATAVGIAFAIFVVGG